MYLLQELSMELNLRIYWVDRRLQVGPYFEVYPNNTYMNANPALLSKIWTPDVYTGRSTFKNKNRTNFIFISVFKLNFFSEKSGNFLLVNLKVISKSLFSSDCVRITGQNFGIADY
jgi:hypothetical protein